MSSQCQMDVGLGLPSEADVDILLELLQPQVDSPSHSSLALAQPVSGVPGVAVPVHPAVAETAASPVRREEVGQESSASAAAASPSMSAEQLYSLLCSALQNVADAASCYSMKSPDDSAVSASLVDPVSFFVPMQAEIVDLWCRSHSTCSELEVVAKLLNQSLESCDVTHEDLQSAAKNTADDSRCLEIKKFCRGVAALQRFEHSSKSVAAWCDSVLALLGVAVRREEHGRCASLSLDSASSPTGTAQEVPARAHLHVMHDVSHRFNHLRHRASPFLFPENPAESRHPPLLYFDTLRSRCVLLPQALPECRKVIGEIEEEIVRLRELLKMIAAPAPSLMRIPHHLHPQFTPETKPPSAPTAVISRKEMEALERSAVIYPRICVFEHLRNTLIMQLALSEAEDHELTTRHAAELLQRHKDVVQRIEETLHSVLAGRFSARRRRDSPAQGRPEEASGGGAIESAMGRGDHDGGALLPSPPPVSWRTAVYDDADGESELAQGGALRRAHNSTTNSPALAAAAGAQLAAALPPPIELPDVAAEGSRPPRSGVSDPPAVNRGGGGGGSPLVWRSIIEDLTRVRGQVQQLRKALWRDILTRRIAISQNRRVGARKAEHTLSPDEAGAVPAAKADERDGMGWTLGSIMCCKAEAPTISGASAGGSLGSRAVAPADVGSARVPLAEGDAYMSAKLQLEREAELLWERVERLADVLERLPVEQTGGFARDWRARVRQLSGSLFKKLEGVSLVLGAAM